MSSNLTPYNFTITDQSPLFQYSPLRDGAITNGWNVTYPARWNPGSLGAGVRTLVGSGASSHTTTFVGASARLDWKGTAVYLYGEGSQDGYTIDLDGTQITQTPGVLNVPGLLFSQSGLAYGSHSLVLTVVQSGATISKAIITVGLGEVGTMIQNRTIETTTIPLTTPGFVLSGVWISQLAYGTGPIVPRIRTNVSGGSISFPLTSASAFYIVGSVNINHGLFDVTMSPSSNVGPQQYNGSSSWVGLDTMLYLATGLNRSQTYQIEMKNDSPDMALDLSSIVVFDPSPPSSSSPLPSQSNPPSPGSLKHIGIGAIVGIAVGTAFILLTFVALLFYCRRQRQRDTGQPTTFTTEHRPLSAGDALPTSYMTTTLAPDVQSGNSSVPIWEVNQHDRKEPQSRHGGHGSPTSSTSPQNTWHTYEHPQINQHGRKEPHSRHGRHGSPTPSTSPQNTWHTYEHPQISGSATSNPSTSTERRLTTVSDRFSVPHVPVDRNEHRVASPPVDVVSVSDAPPAYAF